MRIPPQTQAEGSNDPVQPSSRPRTPLDNGSSDAPALDLSWCPVGTPTHSESGHTDDDDDDSLVTLGSSVVFSSNGSTGTRREEEGSSADEHELDEALGHHRPASPSASELLGGESYIDAEAPSTILSSSSGRSAAPAQMPLIYPYPDLADSFASSTTASDTTPSASVGALQSVSDAGPIRRSSRYRLQGSREGMKNFSEGGEYERALANSALSPFVDSAQPMDRLEYSDLTGTVNSVTPGPTARDDTGVDESKVNGGRVAVDSPRLRLAVTTARGIRQRWSLRMSIIALTSLVSIAIATVQYSTTGHPVAQPQTATPDTRSYSILDYLSAPPISSSILSETGSSSFIPDVRLIKNALSLSTKSVALAPAEVRSTVKAHKPQAQVPISRSAGPTADSLSLSLRNTDVGLTTLSDVSAKWHKSLKDLVKGSVPKATEKASPPVNLTRQGECGYGQVLLSDLKSAWTRAISGFSYTDFIHFVRNQIFATIKAEINEAIYLAHEVSALSRNFTRLTASYLLKGSVSVRALVDDEIRHIFVDKLGFDYHSLSAFNATRVRSAATKQAAQNARSGLNALSSQAAMGARFGKEAIYKARAGLDHLITEAQRLRKGEGDEKEMPLPLKWECRAAHGRGQNKGHPGRWSRRRGNGRTATSPRLARRRSPTETSWRQRFFQAVHNAAPALIR